jgi:hypothetical protein
MLVSKAGLLIQKELSAGYEFPVPALYQNLGTCQVRPQRTCRRPSLTNEVPISVRALLLKLPSTTALRFSDNVQAFDSRVRH